MKSSVKFIIASILFLCSFDVEAQKTISSYALLQTAYKRAATENKNVFIIFHASWCGWCKKLDASMNDTLTKKYFEKNFIVVHLTVLESPQNKKLENEGALELLTKYKGEEAGLPFFVITDKREKIIGDSNAPDGNTGCPSKEMEVDYFIRLLKKSSKINSTGLEIIRSRFRKNDL
jgi:thioredoxin-related protein